MLPAWEEERPLLGELVALPRPFDIVVARIVVRDCTVRFEPRTYSVSFGPVGSKVASAAGPGSSTRTTVHGPSATSSVAVTGSSHWTMLPDFRLQQL